ncbi:MAG: MGMT family protein [Microbacteriaceae bacterium]
MTHTPEFTDRVVEVVDSIPPGCVMTYGEVAAHLGSRAARAVGHVMSHYGSDIAWWRVVRASGHAPAGHESRAREHYIAEGTPLIVAASGTYRIDLRAARVPRNADIGPETTPQPIRAIPSTQHEAGRSDLYRR